MPEPHLRCRGRWRGLAPGRDRDFNEIVKYTGTFRTKQLRMPDAILAELDIVAAG